MTDTATSAAAPAAVKLTIDGTEITAEPGELLIKAAQRAGVFIPRFCWHERMKPVGMCRACLVEIEGVRGLPPACTTPVTDGMVVHFHQENVSKAHEGVLEFLLANHPLDCPVCDRGGECPLQDQTVAFGPGESRFVEEKRHWEKPIPISDLVLLDRERCIQCARCTRFADEIAGDPLIQFIERGGHTEVNTFPDEPFSSYFSGNVVQICPVGALTSSSYRFAARPWDLGTAETTCDGCAVGCRVVGDTSDNSLLRVLGVDADPVNQGWLCDKGRYGLEYTRSAERLSEPTVLRDGDQVPVAWPHALDEAAKLLRRAVELHGPESIALLGGGQSTNEDLFAWKRLFGSVFGSSNLAADLGDTFPSTFYQSAPRATIDDLASARAIVLLGPDPKEALPVLALRIRHAAVEQDVPLIEVSATRSGLAPHATVIEHSPGEAITAARQVVQILNGTPEDQERHGGIAERIAGRSGNVVVVAGRSSLAESADSALAALGELLQVGNTTVLPAVREANAMGAVELGYGVEMTPSEVLERAARGAVHVLVLLGSDVLEHTVDRTQLNAALGGAGAVIAISAFPHEGTAGANVVLPTTVWGEQSGTLTNLEGRVQRVAARLSPVLPVLEPWQIANEIARRSDANFPLEDEAFSVTNAIAAEVARFAGTTDEVVARARDGVLLPFDAGRTVWRNDGPVVDTPSWEPIPPAADPGPASETASDTDSQVSETAEAAVEDVETLVTQAVAPAPSAPAPFSFPTAPKIPPRDGYAVRLVTQRPMYDGSRRVMSSSSIAGLGVPPHLRLHPSEMARLGATDGDVVRATSTRGTVAVPVFADLRVPPGVAAMPAGVPGAGAADLIDASESVTDLRLEFGS